MAQYEYNAIDAEGRSVTGRVEADDIEQVVARLTEQGLSVHAGDIATVAHAPKPGSAPRLSGRETAELVEAVVDLAGSRLPLSAGLRAAAAEVPQRRVAEAMQRMAGELDRGVSLDTALNSASSSIPAHLQGLILAGLRTGRVAHVLEELVAMDRDQVDMRQRIAAALAYPTFLFVMLIGLFFLAETFIVRPFAGIFDEFGMELPAITVMLISMANWFDVNSLWTLAIVVGIVLPAIVFLLIIPKPPGLQRACYLLPVIGPLWRWQSLVDFSRLMHLLLDRQVPMVDALRLTADGLRWSDLAEVSRSCAGDVERGMDLSESMARYPQFPPSMRPVIDSGLETQQPAEAFAAAADMYRRRAGVDATLWEAILPPLMLVLISVGVGFLVFAMIAPMIKLISALT
jgi:type II secretory pathway component PulF